MSKEALAAAEEIYPDHSYFQEFINDKRKIAATIIDKHFAELLRDKARLDWLNNNNVVATIRTDKVIASELAIIGDDGCCERVIDAVTIRQAIDAALTSDKK